MKALKHTKDWNRQIAVKQQANKIPIVINGVSYPSLVHASHAIGVSDTTVKKMYAQAMKTWTQKTEISVNVRTTFKISVPKVRDEN